jgi:hypothetical protein
LNHVDQRQLEFKVSVSHRHVRSGRNMGVGGGGEIADRPLGYRC